MTEKKTKGTDQQEEPQFSKQQLLVSERFRERKDLVNALLSMDKQYTVKTVEQMIEEYRKGQVK